MKRVALITGGSRGIGFGIAQNLPQLALTWRSMEPFGQKVKLKNALKRIERIWE